MYDHETEWMGYVDAVVTILDNADHGGETRLVPFGTGYELLGTNLGDDGYYVTIDMVFVTKTVGDRLYRDGYVEYDTP